MDTREGWLVGYDPDLDRGYIRNDLAFMDLTIQFQHVPIAEAGVVNGFQDEEFIQLLIMRIEALDLRMPSQFNQSALTQLNLALGFLNERTKKRQEQGVEGTSRPHSDTEEIIPDA